MLFYVLENLMTASNLWLISLKAYLCDIGEWDREEGKEGGREGGESVREREREREREG